MKLYSKLLTLCAFHPNVSGIGAFSVQTPRAHRTALRSSPGGEQISGSSQQTGGQSVSNSPANAIQTQAAAGLAPVKNIWETSDSIIIQGGGSLRTWSTPTAERVQLSMRSEGRPMNANVELWQGPDNTPQKMSVYIEDGNLRPFNVVVETPRGPNSIALYNTGQLEFPFTAVVEADVSGVTASDSPGLVEGLRIIQGGALKTFPFAPTVASVQILIRTDGRPLNSRIELLQGPNNQKQVMDIYTEDGMERPFFVVIGTPGSGNVIRVLNTAPMEYPMSASVQPYLVEDEEFSGGWRG